MNQQHNNDLINEIGALIVNDPPTEGMDWNTGVHHSVCHLEIYHLNLGRFCLYNIPHYS